MNPCRAPRAENPHRKGQSGEDLTHPMQKCSAQSVQSKRSDQVFLPKLGGPYKASNEDCISESLPGAAHLNAILPHEPQLLYVSLTQKGNTHTHTHTCIACKCWAREFQIASSTLAQGTTGIYREQRVPGILFRCQFPTNKPATPRLWQNLRQSFDGHLRWRVLHSRPPPSGLPLFQRQPIDISLRLLANQNSPPAKDLRPPTPKVLFELEFHHQNPTSCNDCGRGEACPMFRRCPCRH